MKRGRNHQRRRQGANPNRALDSNGPDVRIRGTAQQIYDKYQALARDAHSSGDRVKAENYLQHAEHYWRLLRSMQGPQAQPFDPNGDSDVDADQPQFDQQGRGDRGDGDRDTYDEQPTLDADDADENGDFSERPATHAHGANGGGHAPQGQNAGGQHSQGAGGSGDERRSRRRRPRRHPREAGAAAEGAEANDEPETAPA